MPIRRKPEEAVPFLVKCLKDAKERAGIDPSKQTNVDDVNNINSFRDVETKLEEIKDSFPKFKHFEDALMDKFTALEQHMDDDDQVNNIVTKVNYIGEKLVEIQNLISQVKLPTISQETTSQDQQQAQPEEAPGRKVSEDWLLLNVDENILVSAAMANLQASYDFLEPQLKLCLLSLVIFPEKYVIKKRPLIYWWIGEGLISKIKTQKTAEKVGEEIFEKLIEMGLIQPYQKKKRHVVDSCTMHPWVRRMLIPVAKKAEFFDFDSKGKLADDYSRSRRACLVSGNRGFLVNNNNNNINNNNNNPKEDDILTLFNVDEPYLSVQPDSFSKLKKVVVIQLGRWHGEAKHHIEVENDEFLKGLGALKHLKYLSLQGISRITELPSSLVHLINLEILDLRACHNLEKLPPDIGSLRKLTHLDISKCYLLETIPKGIEKLSLLQVLKGFVIGSSKKAHCKLSDLAQLKKLRKLSIYIRSETVIEEKGELDKLKNITTLRVLTISWGKVSSPLKKEGAQLNRTLTITMESFSFPPKLEKLDLWCPPRSPNWLKPSGLEDLERLYIRGGGLENFASDQDKKWKVKILRFKYLKNLKVDWPGLKENEFPDLVYFERTKCQNDEDVEWLRAEETESKHKQLKPDESNPLAPALEKELETSEKQWSYL